MNDIRAKFEEIWPVPEDVTWCDASGAYWFRVQSHEPTRMANNMNIRLDTFTRCQETMAPVMSLVDELINELDEIADWVEASRADCDDVIRARRFTSHAKQVMEKYR